MHKTIGKSPLRKLIFRFISLIYLTGITACTLLSADQEILIKPPSKDSLPLSSHSSLTGWDLVVSTKERTCRNRIKASKAFRISVPRESFTVILMYPVMEPGGVLNYPAGTIVLPGWSDSETVTSWRGGWAADLLYRLTRQGFDMDGFNSLRFLNEVENHRFPDPWLIDRNKLEDDFSSESFNLNSLKSVPVNTVYFTGLPSGFALPENPFSDPVYIPENGNQGFNLPEGSHRYWLPDHNLWLLLGIFGSDTGDFSVSPLQNK